MQKINLKIQKLDEKVTVPCYQTEGAAGMDLCAFLNEPVTLKSLERKLIPTGLKMELPHGYEAQVRPRSGMSIKHGITLVNCVGTIDEDYRGELCVPVINLSTEEFTIQNGDRIAQMIVAPVTKAEISVVTELSDTQRGEGGFGSTGKN
ncbi:MAG TPA: dUTP diphosphatase [Candidatus Limenecus avicola]|uniref:Deoxyuridine 5'-triphosphate nucleotidohydrolase n=1 Tax=Candidatus Limenecus avicola TaxID=2840847 RepID=A0A9D1SR84_9CLOT|nr:dUTP diphosphatase [Clostridium sp.]CDC21260.1 deoxyuridine 5'-triphosphate nucleotidohydrolase [Clostridium sp. CAG:306]HIU92783.1 dUTP diphosphatase [Candidatus Limenecus avicola]